MEQLSFQPITPPEAVLSRYQICNTNNIEEARQVGEKIFCANRLSTGDRERGVNTRIFYRKVGGIGLGRMSYGGDVTITPGTLDTFALIQMPIRGREQVEQGEKRVLCTPGMGAVFNPNAALRIDHTADTEN